MIAQGVSPRPWTTFTPSPYVIPYFLALSLPESKLKVLTHYFKIFKGFDVLFFSDINKISDFVSDPTHINNILEATTKRIANNRNSNSNKRNSNHNSRKSSQKSRKSSTRESVSSQIKKIDKIINMKKITNKMNKVSQFKGY